MTELDSTGPIPTAIVTGAAQGIGRAEAERLVASGRRVVLADIDAPLLARTVDELGGPAHAIGVPGDISDPETSEALIAAATADGLVLDTVISNAAVLRTGMIFDHADADWDAVLSVTLSATFRLSRAAALHWRDNPSTERRNLVLTTSRAALLGNPGQTAYAAAKAGVAVMTHTLARELKPYGVQVNAIAPRAYTKMMRDGVGEFAESALAEWSPTHIGRFVEFLCSPEGSGISGQIFVVHGPRAQLVRTFEVCEPVEFDFGAGSASVKESVERLFARDPKGISDFMVDDLPLADSTTKSPFAVADSSPAPS
ncbi:SDR family oxidoreductase [Rhodococcus rhodochrous]|uniref:SDR family oxidoreductase n=1 Tax=Rhodococcus rhodochrous TaxID=1829 RepID=A0AA46X3Q3_RHORH|nr:SDR family oxidoreductase [Rhodococcus rhodochrous]MCB8913956.1 SDR family oxidoreductase [Rhodococcus rhodochrous]UZF48329.1 SDR family oxidoreductase [Rhodococcus rhodochrous]